jgi:hypothetical protein
VKIRLGVLPVQRQKSLIVLSIWVFCLGVLIVIASRCGSPPPRSPESKVSTPPPAPVTGRFAFQRMYIQAGMWAKDAQPLRLTSFNLKDVASENGKCGAWQASFVSIQKGRARSYTFSAVDSPGNVREGVVAGREEGWGSGGQAQPFVSQALKIDSDEAFATAVKHSAAFLKKNPEVPVHFLLELTPRFPNPTWRVVWGKSLGASDHTVFVDATSGRHLQTLK